MKKHAKKGMSLSNKILLGMALGLIVGLILKNLTPSYFLQTILVDGLLDIVGQIFIKLLKMLVVPIVFIALVCGITNLGDNEKLGQLGWRTLLLFVTLNVIAVTLSLFLSSIMRIGSHAHLTLSTSFKIVPAITLKEMILNIIPTNPIEAMTQNNLVPVIVFAILIGIAISMAGEKGKTVAKAFQSFNVVLIKLINIIMQLAPYGVFCLISVIITKIGFGFLNDLLMYFLAILVALMIQLFGTYSLFLFVFGKLNPLLFFRKMRSTMLFAFSTSSSNATIPINLDTTQNKLGVDSATSAFIIPLGANIHLNGTAIMQGAACVFIANIYHIPLTLLTYLIIIAMTTVTAMSTAGIPSAGMLTLAMVLKQAGLPIEAGIGLIFGIDRLVDMFRTIVNVSGDTATACIISNRNKSLNRKIYNSETLS